VSSFSNALKISKVYVKPGNPAEEDRKISFVDFTGPVKMV